MIARLLERVLRVLGSFALCIGLLAVLFLLTGFGTLEQRYASIYDVQRKYFESLFLTEIQITAGGPIPVLLPGGYVVLTALAINLLIGGVVRVRKSAPALALAAATVTLLVLVLPRLDAVGLFVVGGLVTALLLVLTGWVWPRRDWARLGVLVTHGGILVLLAAGLVEFHFSTKGTLALAEQEVGGVYQRAGDEFQAYYEWDVILAEHLEGGGVREHILPFERFEDLGPGQSARFESAALPFDVRVSGFARNCLVVQEPSGGVDGLALRRLDPDREKAEVNTPGMLLTLIEKGAGAPTQRALLHAEQAYPWRVEVATGGSRRTFDADLRRRRWAVPFTLKLDDFTAAYYPGTNRPKEFSSRVTKLEDGSTEPVLISMNQPLRHKGYTFFQSSFEPPRRVELPDGRVVNTPWVSIFSVVRNPADAWPLTACGIILVGLSVMMLRKLGGYVRAEARRRAA